MARARTPDDEIRMAPSVTPDSRASTSRHALQRRLIAGGIVVLAALLALSITALRGHADRARQTQIVVAELRTDAEHIGRVEWQATAEGRGGRELSKEFELVHRHIDSLLDDYTGSREVEGPPLAADAHDYVHAVETELALFDGGRVATAERVNRREVDPSFERLQRRLERIDTTERTDAERAARWTDLGIIASLLLAALVLIVLLSRFNALRSAAAVRRNHDLEVQALHDALTGLPNRRKLLIDLERELRRADGGKHRVLVLCDLDGFKAYNDTFGHPEGDLLLARLGRKLARTVAPHGTAYRLGGDEFCALLRGDRAELAQALEACRAALCETGSGFEVQASLGSVALSEEASDMSTALRLADQRMYAQKNESGSSVRQQLRDVILRVISEHDPELYNHGHDVAGLSARVGRRHGLNDAQIVTLVRAAELHDVGKVAIPDSILHKPGALDPDEQEFMQRHTLIGESILSAAPALAGVGELVRSTHERYDGTGYPDGMRGEDIPIASRIIFVCDSFNAMISERPYSSAMSRADALAELGRCSGTQFDPAVVDTFVSGLFGLDTTRPTLRAA
jgi:diguanylate cyclase (GGDEF)-like protein